MTLFIGLMQHSQTDDVDLARADMAVSLAGLFLKTHPNLSQAHCDSPRALTLDQLEEFLSQVKAIEELVKSMPTLTIE